jgi:hypothetical protein
MIGVFYDEQDPILLLVSPLFGKLDTSCGDL